jgi:hypothetical protein
MKMMQIFEVISDKFNPALMRWENVTEVVRWGPTDPTK